MIKSIYTINRNMNILQKKHENTSANIANINTPGFKEQNIIQSTLEAKEMTNFTGGVNRNEKRQLGNFVFGNQIDGVYNSFEQGSLTQTFNTTDFAIIGNGFFTVQMDDGQIAFTRNGNFKVNELNELTTMEGYKVLGGDDKGGISHLGSNLLINDFNDYSELNSIGDTLFTSNQPGFTITDAKVSQGFLEMSNVKVVDQLIKMIEVSREFEANQKLLHSADETLSKAVNEIGRV